MTTIREVKLLPGNSPVDAIQGLVRKVFPQETVPTRYGDKSIQRFFLVDASGDEIKCEVWGHSDVSMYEGKEIVVKQGRPGKGVVLQRENYVPKGSVETVESVKLSLSGAAQFQIVAGSFQKPAEAAQSGSPARAVPAEQSAKPAYPTPKSLGLVAGQSVGAALNQAHELMRFLYNPPEVQALLANGDYWEKLGVIASAQIKLAQELEHGKVYETKKV